MPIPSSRPRCRRMELRVAAFCGVAAVTMASGAGLASCILADPPAALPTEPPRRPAILHESVAPPATSILATWPRVFDIPVEVAPSQAFKWRAFLDYDPRNRGNIWGTPGQSSPDPASDDGGVRLIPVELPAPTDLRACHTLEVLVAIDFDEDHTPAAPGGDSVVWFYSPTGDLSSCPIFDGGPAVADGSFPNGDGGLFLPSEAGE